MENAEVWTLLLEVERMGCSSNSVTTTILKFIQFVNISFLFFYYNKCFISGNYRLYTEKEHITLLKNATVETIPNEVREETNY
jgi:hypothetical protein